MSRRSRVKDKKIEQYEHRDAVRLNNPPVGLVTPALDPEEDKTKYSYDPHLDPQLVWAGKTERTSFGVDTVSLHVHERIDPITIITSVRKQKRSQQSGLYDFFSQPEENPPLRDAIQFYKHSHGWSNRLIAGDSLLVMNSLLEKEGMAGQVQMVYIDPPYGISYSSNFQPFVNKKDVKDGRDEDLTQEPEMIKAFRDTWELGVHSYLSYLRDRLLLVKELLSQTGSCFVQISDENLHHVREIMDEVFGSDNFVRIISFRKKSMAFTTKLLAKMDDYIIWYAKEITHAKYHSLFKVKDIMEDSEFAFIDTDDGGYRRLKREEKNSRTFLETNIDRIFKRLDLCASGYGQSTDFPIEIDGKIFRPRTGVSWKTHEEGIIRLKKHNRIFQLGKSAYYKVYFNDFPLTRLTNLWTDTRGEVSKIYVVQTSETVIQRCMLMTTDPGDLILDPTCGSGTSAFIAEKWGRRWITCDTSRIALNLAKQRLMTGVFDYYTLADYNEGIKGNFEYTVAAHVTLGSIANEEFAQPETLFDDPIVDKQKIRVSGPFTVEALPSIFVMPIDTVPQKADADISIVREGETLRQTEWKDELLKTGIRGKAGQKIEFTRVEALSGTVWLHANAETKESEPKRAVISFGPEYSPLDLKQVERAITEAQKLWPKPELIIFASFQFDSEAAKDIDETIWPGVTLLKVQMNVDLLTEDLKKKGPSNESFWLIGQPDVKLINLAENSYQVEVQGFDYYNVETSEIESGGPEKIAMWMLDTDYDYRSLFPRQVFFPMAGNREGWSRLARTLKTEINADLIKQYKGIKSIPFKLGENKTIAVKIVDDRGIESLKILKVS